MNRDAADSHLLSMPTNAGRSVVEAAALIACPLLGTSRFISFCRERDIQIDRERLHRFERMGLFSPIFRTRIPDDDDANGFRIPIDEGSNWFDKGWAWDTTAIPACHEVPDIGDDSQEGYYSIFQLDWLSCVMSEMTLHVHLDSYLETKDITQKAEAWWRRWLEHAKIMQEGSRDHVFRPSIALLCQYISNRYYPKTQGDLRTIRIGGGSYSDQWICVNGHRWDWAEAARKWDAKKVESLFKLTPEKLKHVYTTLAAAQSFSDPLQDWYPLIQFVSIDQRKRLKGGALRAETLREGALMLRWLYQDLYGEELPPPNEVHGTVITHMPELVVRKDVRRYLEFVVNRYGLNPQPKLVLIVEGQTEERVVNKLFDELFGFAPSICWIELLVIGGVDNATGSKREDRFRAIFRLIDYLHHHQTLVYLLLDNENQASRLKHAAREARSIHGHRSRVTRSEYIRIWKISFEFDNFSDTEIASAMSGVTSGRYRFNRKAIAACRASKTPGADLGRLYKVAMQRDIPKLELADVLMDKMLDAGSRKAVANRPVVQVLERVVQLATKNPFPVMLETWEKNQMSKVLAKKR